MFGINQLSAAAGSVSPGGDAEWNAYFNALRSNINAKWSRAVDSYKTLKNVRETLGLPFIMNNGTGEGGPNPANAAWNNDLEQQAVNIHAMTVLIDGALKDVVDNKRRVAPTAEGDGWGIELLQSDILKMGTKPPGIPVLLNAKTGAEEQVMGKVEGANTLGAIWVPAAILAAGLVVTVGEIYLASRAIDSLTAMAQEKTTRTIATRNAELVASGKATPEQAAALTKAEGQAATDLAKARAEEKEKGGVDPTKWTPLVKTIVWGGAAIMGLWIISKVVGGRSGGGVLAANPVEGNPTESTLGGYTLRKREPRDGGTARYVVSKGGKLLGSIEHVGQVWLWEHYNYGAGDSGVTDTKIKAVKLAAGNSRVSNPMWGGKWLSPFDREAPPATRGARKYHLTRVYLDRGGYADKGRRYFGVGKPLYEYTSTDGEVHGYLRASSRAEAKKHLRDEQGGARFFNPLAFANLV